MNEDFDAFRNREIKAKEIFIIQEISKNDAYEFVKKYHYLKGAKFFSKQSFGLFYKKEMLLVGVASYSTVQGIVSLKGWFSLSNDNTNIYELQRLCMLPQLNGTNATSFLLGGSIKLLKKEGHVRAVTTLADSSRHIGSIYQVCNFKYYGLTEKRVDFYSVDGKVNPRGSTKDKHGICLPRTRKHRYCYLLDKTLKINYQEQPHPTVKETIKTDCCGGTKIIYDKRFKEYYTCPKCTGKLELIRQKEMKTYIYDIEVFAKDWLVVATTPDEAEIIVIHNNHVKLKELFLQSGVMFCGFNNKHYDDWVVMTMLLGGSVDDVKAHNDFIITGGNGWEFPFIRGQKKPFKTFDLRDDISDQGLSLKAIEGNINEPIVESSIPFDYPDKLNKAQLDEVVHYCKNDVKNTVKLYHLRKSYLDGKKAVGNLKGMDVTESLALTNPKLTATFLEAKIKDHDDEFIYNPPKELILNKYTEPLDFYKTIDYEKTLVYTVADVPQHYGWGGIHSARPNYFDRSTDKEKIVDIDVGSYYPSLMIQYGYISRNIPDAKGYEEVYKRRLEAKHNGNDAAAGALKLVLNSTYGAMKNKYNPLYDPHGANHICISGQLFLTDLVEKLETVEGFKLIQSNTDGLIIKYPVKNEKQINAIVAEWEHRTRLNMEYTEIHRIAQKDVNNYIIEAGATYLIKDGVKTYTKPDKHKITTKGGWVSLWEGGSFKNNSLVIVHKCLVRYFMDGIPPEQTINEATNIFDFQMICKTGRTFDRTVWEVDGADVEVQRVNRVYAVNDNKYGLVYKCKGDSKNKLPDLPDHCYVDNNNKLTLDQVDKSYYVNLAWKRIKDYKGEATQKTKKEVKKLTTTTKPATVKLNLLQKLIKARLLFLENNVEKGGANRAVGYEYFELGDIVPTATKIFNELGLLYRTTFMDNHAYGLMYDVDEPDVVPLEFMFEIKHLSPTISSKTGNPLQTEPQLVGSEITFYRRYLYMLALDICEHDKIEPQTKPDDQDEDAEEKPKTKKTSKRKPTVPATEEERKDAVKTMTGGSITDIQKTAIKNALKVLRNISADADNEQYIATVVNRINAGMSSNEAEQLLIEVGEKVNKAVPFE